MSQSESEETDRILDELVEADPARLKESDPASFLNKSLEKLVNLKRNFMGNPQRVPSHRSRTDSILTGSDVRGEERTAPFDNPDRSVSTEVSVFDIIENLSGRSGDHPAQNDSLPDDLDAVRLYLSKVQRCLKGVRAFVTEHKIKLDSKFIDFVIQVCVTHHLVKEEIDLAFQFFNALVDHRKKTALLTEEAFSRLLYELMLALDPESISEVVYDAIENYVLYVNRVLKVVKWEADKMLLNEKSILGFKSLFQIYCDTPRPKVQRKCEKLLAVVLRSQMRLNDASLAVIANHYFNLISDSLSQCYGELVGTDQERRILSILTFGTNLFRQVGNAKDEGPVRDPTGEVFEIYMCDCRYNNTKEKVLLKVAKWMKVSDLKAAIAKQIWARPENLTLLTKGNYLRYEERTLGRLKIEPLQTVMVVERNLEEIQLANDAKNHARERLETLRSIFPTLDPLLLQKALETNNMEVEETVLMLSEPAKLDELQQEVRSQNQLDKSPKTVNRLRQHLRLRFGSAPDVYALVYKFSLLKSPKIKEESWNFLRILPPSPQFLDSFHQFMGGCRDFSGKTVAEFRERVGREGHWDIQEAADLDPAHFFSFEFDDIVASGDPLKDYKHFLFRNLVSIFSRTEDETEEFEKFFTQQLFIKKGGLELVIELYQVAAERLAAVQTVDLARFTFQLGSIIRDYFYAAILFSQGDPTKRAKQIFGRKVLQNKSLPKIKEFEIQARQNLSSDNIFTQNLNVSRRNNSQSSLMTPNFASPSFLTRFIPFGVFPLPHPQTIHHRKGRHVRFRVDPQFPRLRPQRADVHLHQKGQ